MQDFSFFFLKPMLPFSVAVIVFFLIGILIAKMLWGRFSQRLNNAVEENLNLASQWSALGASQRDLFKKLRSRWQADRDAWESRLSTLEEDVLAKDSRIAQLTAELQGSGKAVPAGLAEDDPIRNEVRSLKEKLEAREQEIAEMKEREQQEVTVSPLVPLAASPEGLDDNQRVQELEQDLIDTHDELHRVREDYLKQVELVESLESRLIESEKQQAQPDLEEEVAAHAGAPAQINALLARRSAELLSFRNEVLTLKSQNKELQVAAANSEELDRLSAKLVSQEGLLAEKEKELNEVNTAKEEVLAEKETELNDIKAAKEAALAEKEEELNEVKAAKNEQTISIESLELKVEERDTELANLRAKIDELEVLNGRRAGLQLELNDAHHEMYDVRNALKERLDEIGILEARMDELDLVEDEAHALAGELKDNRHELSDVRIALNAKSAEYDKIHAEMEELEAIIEDRGAEVNDLSSEVRQQRDEIRSLKNSLAEKEGELEALGEESNTFTLSLNAKDTFLNEQTVRIADLEQSLAERYDELNEVRRQLGDDERDAKHHKARADQLEAELERRKSEFDASDNRLAEAENEIEAANGKIVELTEKLVESDQSIADLEEQLAALSRDKDETLRDLDLANKRVEELEIAAKERQERIVELELESRETSQNAGVIQRKVDSLNIEIAEANRHREEAQGTLRELEDALRSSDEKTLKLSREIEERDSQLDSLRKELAVLETQVEERNQDISEARAEISHLENELASTRSQLAKDKQVLESKRAGMETDFQTSIESLKSELSDRENSLQQYVEQQKQSVAEIEKLRAKVAKRGDAIRELQAEVSNIMLQRSERDDEISLLKEKLRTTEQQFDGESLDEALQQSLLAQPEGGGMSLDELDEEPESHHAPNPIDTVSASLAESEMDEDAVYFDEGSAALTDRSLARLDELARSLRRGGRSRASVAVIAFSGAEGTPDFNESLSARRADSVRERLLERGVPRSMIDVQSSGQDRRFTDWRARRAELVLVPNAVAETVN